jgi:hypothetical protein
VKKYLVRSFRIDAEHLRLQTSIQLIHTQALAHFKWANLATTNYQRRLTSIVL